MLRIYWIVFFCLLDVLQQEHVFSNFYKSRSGKNCVFFRETFSFWLAWSGVRLWDLTPLYSFEWSHSWCSLAATLVSLCWRRLHVLTTARWAIASKRIFILDSVANVGTREYFSSIDVVYLQNFARVLFFSFEWVWFVVCWSATFRSCIPIKSRRLTAESLLSVIAQKWPLYLC